jgi:YYY domain-containing protein
LHTRTAFGVKNEPLLPRGANAADSGRDAEVRAVSAALVKRIPPGGRGSKNAMEYALVIRWLVLFAALFAAGLPLAARLLPDAAGRGAGLALPIALVVLTVPAYWVGQVAFGPVALAAGVVVLLAASVAAAFDRDALREGRLEPAVDVDVGAAGDAAAVFVAGFLFVVAIRAFDPAVFPVGGEKFLDFGLLKSLQRSSTLPPEDFWFAGEPVKYYYGGHLMTTLLSWLSATPPRFAYNLALAGFYGMLVAAAFELAGAIGARRGVPRRAAGLFAAFFVGLASNLVTAVRFVLVPLPDGLERAIAESVAARTEFTVTELLADPSSFSYWDASRVIEGTINEFPLFAWLNGDLHAHMTGTPFLLLAAAVCFAYYRTPSSDRRRRRVLVFCVLPVLAGWQAVHNTWSFPTVLGLTWLALVFAPAPPWTLLPGLTAAGRRAASRSRAAAEATRVGSAFAVVAVTVAAAVVVASPFLFGAATGGGERSVELLGPEMRSSLSGLLLVHGAFLAAFGAYLLSRLRVERPAYLVGALVVAAFVGLRIHFAALVVVVPVLVFGWVALRADRPVGYETVLVVAGAGIVTLVELVYVNEQAGPGRMNTVFKTYAQVWVLWATAMGVVLPSLVRGVPSASEAASGVRARTASVATDGGRVPWRRAAAAAFVVLLVASTSVYGALALGNHFERAPPGGPTLDATQFVETHHPGYAEAIDWLDEREGTPVLLEAPGTSYYPGGTDGRERVMYSWNANPASTLTGIPTVAGWSHEVGYRGDEAYYERVRDVDAMYTGDPTTRAELFRQYDVKYIWYGPSERARYGELSFDMPGVTVAHRSGSVTIYEVHPERLPETGGRSGANATENESG